MGRAGHDVTDRSQLPEDGGGYREGAGPACPGKALRGRSASGNLTVGSVRQVGPAQGALICGSGRANKAPVPGLFPAFGKVTGLRLN